MFGETNFKVNATLHADGEVTAKVQASCAYGERTASVTQDVEDEKLLASIGNVLKKAIGDAREGLIQQATSAAAEALVVATKKGEKV